MRTEAIPKRQFDISRSTVRNLFVDNPMFDEAVRARRRFQRSGSHTGPALYFSVLGLIALVYVWILISIVHGAWNVTIEVSYLELIIVTLAMPLSMYGAIAGERERATWDALTLTRLTPGQILAGKLTWRTLAMLIMMAFLLTLIIVGECTRYDYGVAGILRGQIVIAVWGILLGSLTLWVSCFSKRSITALGITIFILLAALVLYPILLALFNVNYDFDNPLGNAWLFTDWSYPLTWLQNQNPFVALGSVIQSSAGFNGNIEQTMNSYSHFDLLEGIFPVAAIFDFILAAICMSQAYRILRRLELPQETEFGYNKRLWDEILPQFGIGLATGFAFWWLAHQGSRGDDMLDVACGVVGFLIGGSCAWLVSRGGSVVKKVGKGR